MFCINRYCCAQISRAATLSVIIGGAIALASYSSAIAGSFSSSDSVYLSVVDKSGPIRVDYEFVGTDIFGLPSLEIYERFRDGDEGLWADVEVKVTIRHRPSHGGGGHWDGWFDDWGWDDDDWGWGNDDWGWGHDDDWGWGHDDDPVDPNYTFIPEDIVVGIDKFVKNKTGINWENFLIQLGTGVGNDPNDDPFVPSSQDDGLYFVGDPMPKEVTSFYGQLQPNGNPTPNNLLWVDGDQDPGDRSIFWFGVNVPGEWFEQDHRDPEYWHAKFTIRQHVNIPEPMTVSLGCIGLSGIALMRRRRGV